MENVENLRKSWAKNNNLLVEEFLLRGFRIL